MAIFKQYVVDAFTEKVFSGNQAAICILGEWLPEATMMNIARENNLSETAFAVNEGEHFRLRWFTPGGEIDLCGHATLACAYVLFNYYLPEKDSVVFDTLSGELVVTKNGEHGDMFEMEFPAYELTPVPVSKEITEALGAEPREAYLGRDLLCVFDNEQVVRELAPDMAKLLSLDGLLLHVSAAGATVDCVSRSFAPKLSVVEDPVCGSGHCHIIPYWAKRLAKNTLVAYQASKRGGTLYCRMAGGKVFLAGKAVLFSVGELHI